MNIIICMLIPIDVCTKILLDLIDNIYVLSGILEMWIIKVLSKFNLVVVHDGPPDKGPRLPLNQIFYFLFVKEIML